MDYKNLITRFGRKDDDALEEIYDAYGSALYGVINRMTPDQIMADDVLQEVFIKVWKNAHSFDPSKGRLYTWMHRIAVTTTINHMKRRANRVHNEIKDDGSTQQYGIQNTNIDVLDLKGKVRTLPIEQVQVIDLIYFQGYTQQETSEHLNLPLGTVKTRCRTALRNLRKLYLAAPLTPLGKVLIILFLITWS